MVNFQYAEGYHISFYFCAFLTSIWISCIQNWVYEHLHEVGKNHVYFTDNWGIKTSLKITVGSLKDLFNLVHWQFFF